jgi:hypothetical protein
MPNYTPKGYSGPLSGLDLGVERTLANIDYRVACADAVLDIRAALENPLAKRALREALTGL